MRGRCWTTPWGHDKGLYTKAADKVPNACSVAVGRDVALVPGHAKGGIGKLDDEEIESRIWRQSAYLHVHRFDGAERVNRNPPGRVGNAACRHRAARPHYAKDGVLLGHCWPGQT